MNAPRNRKPPRILTLKPALFGGMFFAMTALASAQQPGTATPAQTQDSRQVEAQVETLLNQLTLEEKVNYLAGAPPADPTLPNSTSENVPPVPRLGLPELRNCDGPVGIRVGNEGSTRYPANLLLAATWDPDRAADQGKGIARATPAPAALPSGTAPP
jgi:beta-glucosidase